MSMDGSYFILNYAEQIFNYSLVTNINQVILQGDIIQSYQPIKMATQSQFYLSRYDDALQYYEFAIFDSDTMTLRTKIGSLKFTHYEMSLEEIWIFETKQLHESLGRTDEYNPAWTDKDAPSRVRGLAIKSLKTINTYYLNCDDCTELRYMGISDSSKWMAFLFQKSIQIYRHMPRTIQLFNTIPIARDSCTNLLFIDTPDVGIYCQDESMKQIRYFDIALHKSSNAIPNYLTYTIIGLSAGFVLAIVVMLIINCLAKKKKKTEIERILIDHSENIAQSYILKSRTMSGAPSFFQCNHCGNHNKIQYGRGQSKKACCDDLFCVNQIPEEELSPAKRGAESGKHSERDKRSLSYTDIKLTPTETTPSTVDHHSNSRNDNSHKKIDPKNIQQP
jgi:hypothetical protein